MTNRSHSTWHALLPILSLILLLGLWLLATPAHAATATTINVNSTAQEVPFANNGNCTLGEAIMAAETDSAIDGCAAGNGSDIINLPAGTFMLTAAYGFCYSLNGINSACAFPTINSNLTIQGAGAQNTLIIRDDSNFAVQFRHFYLDSSADLTLKNLTLANGLFSPVQPVNTGGSIYLAGSAKLTTLAVRFENNHSSYRGGAIAAAGTAQINATNTVFVDNNGGSKGGGIYGGHVTLVNSDFSNNQASTGGAVSLPTSLSVTGGTFSDNTATQRGGAIDVCRDTTINNADFMRNQAQFGGGVGIYQCTGQPSATVEIANSDFISNTASNSGGGIYGDTVTMTVTNSILLENKTLATNASFGGGAIYVLDSDVLADQVVVKDNSASHGGGFDIARSSLWLSHSAVIGNSATIDIGSGLRVTLAGTITIENTTISGNSSMGAGSVAGEGYAGKITILQSTITNNSSNSGTGGLYDGNPTPRTHSIENSILAGNQNAAGKGDFQLDIASSKLRSDGFSLVGMVENSAQYEQGAGDIVGTVAMPASADLHALHFLNGHWSHLPQAGGAAMDAIPSGTNGCGGIYPDDQRGKVRPANYMGSASCDIGAIERQSAETHTDHTAVNESQSYGSLQVTLTDNGVYRGALGNVRVTRSNQAPNSVFAPQELPFRVTLTEPTNPNRLPHNINYDLTICYNDWELGQGQSINESALGFLQKVGGNWVYVAPTTRDEVNNCLRLDGLTTLDTWGIGMDSIPTAITGGLNSAETSPSITLLLIILIGLLLTITSYLWRANKPT